MRHSVVRFVPMLGEISCCCDRHLCRRCRPGLPLHGVMEDIPAIETKRQVVLFSTILDIRGYPAADDLETLHGVGEVAVVAVGVSSCICSLSCPKSKSREYSSLAPYVEVDVELDKQ